MCKFKGYLWAMVSCLFAGMGLCVLLIVSEVANASPVAATAAPSNLVQMFADTAQTAEVICRWDRVGKQSTVDEYRQPANPEMIMFQQNMSRRYGDERTVTMIVAEGETWFGKKLRTKSVSLADMDCRTFGAYTFDKLMRRGKF